MTLEHTTTKSADHVIECLTDMQRFVSLHPVIYKSEQLSDHKYMFFETLNMGLISWSFAYPGTIEHDKNSQKVTMRATVMKLVKIEMSFYIKPYGSLTRIDETICFQSLLPVKFLLTKIFMKQHKQLFANIENLD